MVTAAVIAAVQDQLPTRALVVAVLVTLLVYWGAERYSRLVAQRIHAGRRPSFAQVRGQLTSGWELVSATGAPLAVLILVRVLGGSLNAATIWALVCSTVLLSLAGWEIGRGGQLGRVERALSAVVAAAFGGALIVLKALLH